MKNICDTAVYFGAWYFEKRSRKRPGLKQAVNAQFIWGGETWIVPCVYACGEGLVTDIAMEVSAEKMAGFINRHLNEIENSEYNEAAYDENPLNVPFRAHFTLNGRQLSEKHRISTCCIPPFLLPPGEKNPEEALSLLRLYGLDEHSAWVFIRVSCPWATARKPKIRTLAMCLARRPENIPVARLVNPTSGMRESFTDPATGILHTITVMNMAPSSYKNPESPLDLPSHHVLLTYTVTPAIPEEALFIRDESKGSPARISGKNAAAIGIIGGADGPTVLYIGTPSAGERTAVSSMYDHAPDAITWIVYRRVKAQKDISVMLAAEPGKDEMQ